MEFLLAVFCFQVGLITTVGIFGVGYELISASKAHTTKPLLTFVGLLIAVGISYSIWQLFQ